MFLTKNDTLDTDTLEAFGVKDAKEAERVQKCFTYLQLRASGATAMAARKSALLPQSMHAPIWVSALRTAQAILQTGTAVSFRGAQALVAANIEEMTQAMIGIALDNRQPAKDRIQAFEAVTEVFAPAEIESAADNSAERKHLERLSLPNPIAPIAIVEAGATVNINIQREAPPPHDEANFIDVRALQSED